jgi:hypothetical protein
MTRLQLEYSEFTYEGAFVKPVFSLIYTPGMLCDLLLGVLEPFGATSEDLQLQSGDGAPAEQGVTCECDEFEISVTIWGDRLELHCLDFISPAAEKKVASVLDRVWSSLTTLNVGVAPKTHSFLFEMDMRFRRSSYRQTLGRFALVPNSLPPGSETAVVYYLPAEPERGYGESSVVLNRSSAVEHGLQVNATLVYEGRTVPTEPSVAQNRLIELLQTLGLEWTKDGHGDQPQ